MFVNQAQSFLSTIAKPNYQKKICPLNFESVNAFYQVFRDSIRYFNSLDYEFLCKNGSTQIEELRSFEETIKQKMNDGSNFMFKNRSSYLNLMSYPSPPQGEGRGQIIFSSRWAGLPPSPTSTSYGIDRSENSRLTEPS